MELIAHFSAPGRAGVIGNPTDIYGGKVISCSTKARNHCRLFHLSNTEDLHNSCTLIQAAASMRDFNLAGFKLELHSQVPRSSGLAGSTAILASILACIDVAQGRTTSDLSSFAEDVRYCERYHADVMCGYQDAYMAVYGGFRFGDYRGKHPLEPGPSAQLTRITHALPFLLITTGEQRLSGAVHGPLSERWLQGEPLVVQQLSSIAALPELALKAIEQMDLPTLGALMNDNQSATQSLGASGDRIDRLVEHCRNLGAYGAKLAGAGQGGTVIALHPEPRELELGLRGLGYSQFNEIADTPGITRHDVG